jgi:hypothetical protein
MEKLNNLKECLGRQQFRARYTVESVVIIEASPEDVDTFLASDHPKGDGSEADLERNFFAWCIGEDGCDFIEREVPVVLEVFNAE